MESNTVSATLGNKETQLNNEITMKFGLVTAGSLTYDDGGTKRDRAIILDLERLNLFNAVQTDDIRFRFMNVNCLVGDASVKGKDGSFFNFTLYSTVLKN